MLIRFYLVLRVFNSRVVSILILQRPIFLNSTICIFEMCYKCITCKCICLHTCLRYNPSVCLHYIYQFQSSVVSHDVALFGKDVHYDYVL